MKVYLIGMPGSGKSTLGKDLAKALKSRFVDLDEEIEATEGKSIIEIFQEDGEDKFRIIESDLLRSFSKSTDEFVMSTGGGTPCHHDGLNIMNETGVSVYLKVSDSELCLRLEKEKESRPLLARNQSLESVISKLLLERRDTYERAKIIIESDHISTQDLESAIARS
ncbi:MAG: AAA family ATPase [Saprospiraceae bacterium]|nr:AAA family ATPase [Saprospiraceae bacterium]